MISRSLLLVLMNLLTAFAYGKEGFSTDVANAPAAVRAWEPRVFMVSAYGYPLGTAFLVHSEAGALHFLTAKHVAVHCAKRGACALHRRADHLRRTGILAEVSLEVPAADVRLFSPEGEVWRNVESTASDLGYLKTGPFTGAPDVRFGDLPVSRATASHFIVGYPHLTSRPSLDDEEHESIRLRWSEGEALRSVELAAGVTRLSSNGDSLGGNSGGPVVDADGRLVGVLVGGPLSKEYVGLPEYYSYVVPVKYAFEFLRGLR